MRKDWKYILYLSLAAGLFLLVKLSAPRQFNWTPTYAAEDKNPFGAYVLNELLPEIFPGKKIGRSNKTLYELKDSLRSGENIIILTHRFDCGKEDAIMLLEHVAKGATSFLSAQSFSGTLADTLKIHTRDYLVESNLYDQDTAFVKFVNPALQTMDGFIYKRTNIPNYFERFDTLRTSIIAENELAQPVTILLRWGKGKFILNCTPLAFTNIYSLMGKHHEFVSTSLSYLPVKDSHWTQFYSVGRMEASTPLRFILTHEPLAWAYYIAILSLLLFMAFEAKRKQRIIPIVKPLQNTSLEFVGTIGNLYYASADHKNIAEKKITFFFDYVRTRYQFNAVESHDNFISILSKKSGKQESAVRDLFVIINRIRKEIVIRKEDLIELNTLIEDFVSRENLSLKTPGTGHNQTS